MKMVKQVVKDPGDRGFTERIREQLDRDFARRLPADLSHMTEPEKERAATAIFYRASDTLIQSLSLNRKRKDALKQSMSDAGGALILRRVL